jgi:amidophosphoribosyltransferase
MFSDDPRADDRVHDECGVFGVYAPGEDVARLSYFGLFALQHRGQESAGIAVTDGSHIHVHKEMGLVTQVFSEEILHSLKGFAAVGHTRYSTTGSSVLRNAQPIMCCLANGEYVAVAHNGNLTNTDALRTELIGRGVIFESTNDSEVIAHLISENMDIGIVEAVRTAVIRLEGAFSLVIMSHDTVIGVRDAYGVRPLCLGRLGQSHWVLASETCAINTVGAVFVRDVTPGEMIVINADGWSSVKAVEMQRHALCMFESIYFARPDSEMFGRSLHAARRRMGAVLYGEHPVEADLVIGVPDSGTPAALGFAEASGIPFGEGMVKNRYIQRTFIQPNQRMREMGVRMKLTPMREALEGKRVVMVDDSIVRGTTTGKIVRLLLDAGAKEVHVRISSPPVAHPCFYGIDMATQDQLIASHATVEQIREHIGATSLGYLSTDGLSKAMSLSNENFCLACFTGTYPIDILDAVRAGKDAFEPTPRR